ncbi:hypothetical protein HDV01_001053 [Terramyces sp. JEL0728]|nr:hypothetical protein HDV01_001053 [Terramyces sp. JEL0728]
MYDPTYLRTNTTYQIIQLSIQIIVLSITVIFTVYTILSPLYKKRAYNTKIKLLLISSMISQALYIPYFNFSVDVVLFNFICDMALFNSILLTGYCELDFVKIISVLTVFKKRTIGNIQRIWVAWGVVVGHLPIIVFTVIDYAGIRGPTWQVFYNIEQVCSMIFDVSCVLFELTLAVIVVGAIHTYITSRHSTEEQEVNFELAQENYKKLKYLTIGIVCTTSFSMWLFSMRFVYKNLYLQILTSNAAQVVVQLTPILIAYRFLVCQSCLFPKDIKSVPSGNSKKSAEVKNKSLDNYTMMKTRKI